MSQPASQPVLYVPCEPRDPGDPQVRVLAAQPSPDCTVLLVWSSLDLLVAACGEHQPWVSVPLGEAAALRGQLEAVAVVLDPARLTEPFG